MHHIKLKEQLELLGVHEEVLLNQKTKWNKLLSTICDTYQSYENQLKEQVSFRALERGKFHEVLETVPAYISWISSNLEYLGVNQHLAAAFEMSPKDFIGKKIGFKNKHTAFSQSIKEFCKSPQNHLNTEINIEVNNEDRCLLLVCHKYSNVNEAVIIGVDITEKKIAEKSLQTYAEQFQLLIENIPDAVAMCQFEHLTYVNPALVLMLGYTSASTLKKHTIQEVVHKDDHNIFLKHLDLVCKTQNPMSLREYRLLRSDGASITAEISMMFVLYQEKPTVLICARDITERKEMQSRLVHAYLMASMGTLAASIAHEINNPLTYVITNVADLCEEFQKHCTMSSQISKEKLSEFLKILEETRDGAKRVQSIIRDLKSFSRTSEDSVRSTVDIRKVLDSSLNLVSNEFRHKAKLIKNYSEVPCVIANEVRLGQVFLNLLTNAAQAIPEGFLEKNAITVTVKQNASKDVVVEIADTGAGIAPELLSRIFDPFFTTKSVGKGTGLGLSICHEIVKGVGGQISVDSQVGMGTTFYVSFPSIVQSESPVVLPSQNIQDSLIPRSRILIIDDDEILGKTLCRILLREHEVQAVIGGLDAIEILKKDSDFDLILCDIMMPNFSGIDFYFRIAQVKPGLQNKIVFMTGAIFTIKVKEFLAHIPNLKIEKPFDLETIREILKIQMRKKYLGTGSYK